MVLIRVCKTTYVLKIYFLSTYTKGTESRKGENISVNKQTPLIKGPQSRSATPRNRRTTSSQGLRFLTLHESREDADALKGLELNPELGI